MHLLFIGLLLGWGAAIPIGPINLEITRRNLIFGTGYGMSLGIGACAADLTYFILLSSGALLLLQYPLFLQVFGLIGSGILAWFGINILRMPVAENNSKLRYKSVFRTGIEGYFMTLINPGTVLFWGSVSSQISLLAMHHSQATLYAGMGVIVSTLSWILFLNILLHQTRHRLPPKTMHWLNICGGIILLGFAIIGFMNVIISFLY